MDGRKQGRRSGTGRDGERSRRASRDIGGSDLCAGGCRCRLQLIIDPCAAVDQVPLGCEHLTDSVSLIRLVDWSAVVAAVGIQQTRTLR